MIVFLFSDFVGFDLNEVIEGGIYFVYFILFYLNGFWCNVSRVFWFLVLVYIERYKGFLWVKIFYWVICGFWMMIFRIWWKIIIEFDICISFIVLYLIFFI